MLDMATTKKTRATGKPRNSSTPTPKPTRADGRPKSKLTLAGEESALRTKRELLLHTLKQHDWNLTATAEALDMGFAQSVVRALHELAPEEYELAKADGRISQANRRKD